MVEAERTLRLGRIDGDLNCDCDTVNFSMKLLPYGLRAAVAGDIGLQCVMLQRSSHFALFWALTIAMGSATAQAVGAVPPALGLSAFYVRYLSAGGLPVVSSGKVSNAALQAAASMARHMLARRPDLLAALQQDGVRVAVIASSERTTDIPEHSDLQPRQEWDKRARGFGATRGRPVCSVAEENLLGLAEDRYRGESIFVHEFAHTLHLMALRRVDPDFDRKLRALYQDAMRQGLWHGTYAATNRGEYWAEGVQSWFDANIAVDVPNGIHNGIATREALERYDPGLATLIAGVFRGESWRWERPGAHARR